VDYEFFFQLFGLFDHRAHLVNKIPL